MVFCLKGNPIAICCLLAALNGGVAAGANQSHIRSVVRVDARSGRLVRTVVVPPRLLTALSVKPARRTNQAAAATVDTMVPEIVEATARKYDIDPLLVHSVIQVESSYNPYAVSPKGAQGIMQLMPGTARRFGVDNPFDLRDNIEGGVRYLKYLQTLFADEKLAVAAYNAGEGAVWKYNNQVPPYRETEQYVDRVGKKLGAARRAAVAKPKTAAAAPAATVQAASAEPAEPEPARVEAYVDGEGRLFMRNVSSAPSGGGSETSVP